MARAREGEAAVPSEPGGARAAAEHVWADGADAATGMPRWRDVVAPHQDIAAGAWREADFAADLAHAHAGGAGAYGDPEAFFARTFLTGGLVRLLAAATARVSGRGGEAVLRIRAGFGGGKTHALLALRHLLVGGAPAGGAGALAAAGLGGHPACRAAVLAGTELSPGRPWASAALGGRRVRTLWGELAAQVGGAPGYERVRAEDEAGVPPGAGVLAELLDAFGPCAVLIDEPVVFLRALHDRRGLPAGSLDANLSFAHNLAEAARRSRAGLVAAALPESDAEAGGAGGRAAADGLAAALGRLEVVWRPAGREEAAAVVRTRLFGPAADPAARDATCRAFAAMYAGAAADFPPECAGPGYLERLRTAYPVHPELLDLLYGDWSGLAGFQGTRGVLRTLAAVLAELWRRRDRAPLILPGGLPLDAPAPREALLRCLDAGWDAVLDVDVDGPASGAAALERENPRFGGGMARRVARAAFLATAAGAGAGRADGAAAARLRVGTQEPGDPAPLFGDTLAALGGRLRHLHGAGGRPRFLLRPTPRHEADERAAGLDPREVDAEIGRRVQALPPRRAAVGPLAGARVVAEGAPPAPDDAAARLFLLPPARGHRAGAGEASPAVELAGRLLAARTRHPNMAVFLAADEGDLPGLLVAARRYLGWTGLRAEEQGRGAAAEDGDAVERRRQVRDGCAEADRVLEERLHAAYRWILAPAQDPGGPTRWEVACAEGPGSAVQRAARRIAQEHTVRGRWSPAELRLELDRWFWADSPHVRLRRVWEHLTRHLYLPRLGGERVLLEAVAHGVEEGVHFGYAEAVLSDGRYAGLRLGGPAPEPRCDARSVLVKAEVARAHRADGPAGAHGQPEGGRALGAGAPRRAPGPRRFRGSLALDPARPEEGAARVAEEVLRHVLGMAGARVTVTLEIDVRVADGLPEALARTLRENAAALRFLTADFEDGP